MVVEPAEKACTLIDQKKSLPMGKFTRLAELLPFILETIGSPKSTDDKLPSKPFIEKEKVYEGIELCF